MSPSYETNDPKGWCGNPSRGAALGRSSKHAADKGKEVKLHLQEIRLDRGGYDTNGTYFGVGGTLYWVADESGEIDFVIRSVERRAGVKTEIRKDYPKARFYR